MRRSPRLALALLLAASPLSAQDKIPNNESTYLKPVPTPATQVVSETVAQAKTQLTNTITLVRLSDESFKKLQLALAKNGGTVPAVRAVPPAKPNFELPTITKTSPLKVLDEQTSAKLQAVFLRDKSNRVTCAVPVEMQPNGTGSLHLGDISYFVIGVDARVLGSGSVIFQPKNQEFKLGFNLNLIASKASDQNSVRLNSNITMVELISPEATLIPLKYPIRRKNGKSDETEDFTQFLEHPKIESNSYRSEFEVPLGHTALLYGGEWTRSFNSMVSYTPKTGVAFLDRFIQFVENGNQTNHLVVLITPELTTPAPKPMPVIYSQFPATTEPGGK